MLRNRQGKTTLRNILYYCIPGKLAKFEFILSFFREMTTGKLREFIIKGKFQIILPISSVLEM